MLLAAAATGAAAARARGPTVAAVAAVAVAAGCFPYFGVVFYLKNNRIPIN